MKVTHDIRLRHELSNGDLVIIQRIRRKFTCYISLLSGECPETLVDQGNLQECREAAANIIRDDVLEVM